MRLEDACPHNRQRFHQFFLLFGRGLKEGRDVPTRDDQRVPRRDGIAVPQCKDALSSKKDAVGGWVAKWTRGHRSTFEFGAYSPHRKGTMRRTVPASMTKGWQLCPAIIDAR